ncbi:glycosyltransferase family 25 protein [Cobetia sp. D5]|uniref:glycosyltransferase family 25 protein n=1 Tax=Cobetia sp. D5 TaxID=3105867 RepID=UPI002D770D69|nr:glycosyltransferase family 25 protein [Cobetia sp. D5]
MSTLEVDGVFCISLKDRYDRRAHLVKEFEPLGLNIEFYLAERDDSNPERGCYESHRACATLALQRGYQRVLILEDDATLSMPRESKIRRINTFMKLRNPEIFYLGGMLGRMWLIPYRGVVRAKLTGGHAYLLSRKGMKKISSNPYSGKAVDSVYSTRFKAYASYPLLCDQLPESQVESDIANYRINKKGGGSYKDSDYWAINSRKQVSALRRDIWRTICGRWL